jgi:hypothetical protein
VELEELEYIYDEPSEDEDEYELEELFLVCLDKERDYFRSWNKTARPSKKNKKEKITRLCASVREQWKVGRRAEAVYRTPRAIPEVSIRYSSVPVPTYVPPPTQTYTPPPVLHKEIPNYEKDLQTAIQASLGHTHESGITFGQLNDLLNRDLTPEDYELLLLLDSTVSKKTTDESTLQSLAEVIATDEHLGDMCMICMLDYEVGDKLTSLPCKHAFHCDCVGTWLRDHSQSCPLCNAKVAT